MFNKNKKFIFVSTMIFISSLVLISSTQVLSAKNKTKYEYYKDNYKNDIIQKPKENMVLELPEVNKKGNKDSKNLLDFYKLFECENEESFNKKLDKLNAKLLRKDLLTYEEFLDKYNSYATIDLSIAPDRMIYVSEIHYPEGIYSMRGRVENAIVTKFYDAETGENIGFELRSLDKDGMKLQSPWSEEENIKNTK